MQFSDGTWMVKPGYSINKSRQVFEYTIHEDHLDMLVPAHRCITVNDTLAGPNLEYEIYAPRHDMIGVRAIHYRGVVKKGPEFALNTEKGAFKCEDCGETLVVTSGRMKAVIRKEDTNIRFYYDDRLLTESEFEATAYIADVDYEAHDRIDFGHFQRECRPTMRETWMRQRMSLMVGETIYGLGERFTPLVKNGQNVRIWNTDCGSDSDQSYKSIPMYLSSRGFGVLVNTPGHVDYEIGSESTRHVQFTVEGESIDYIVMGAEEMQGVLTEYTAMTGRTAVPPAWSFGLWMSTSWMTGFNGDEIIEIVERMQKLGIPLSVFHFDARWMADFHDCDFLWDKRYGDARAMLKRIHELGVKVCCWINPYVSQPSRLFDEGVKGGYFIKRKDGSVYQNDLWISGMAIVDFTNPEASAWYTKRLREVLDMGVDTIKTDFGERIPTDVVYYDGSDPKLMHNYYTFIYNQAIYNCLKDKYGEEDAMIFGRSSTVGSQQFPVQWGGDNFASYVSMAESLRGGLSFCQSGFGFWAHDISGFNSTATPDLYKRWSAFGMLSTHSRLHGSETPRMPWYFDDESCEVLAHFARLKCSLMPYIYANAVRVNLEGQPEMRAMVLDYPNDLQCRYLDRQYMLGDSLLVAPIFNEEGEADFYLPTAGKWTDVQSGKTYEGGCWQHDKYGYYGMPILVKPNTIIPRGMNTQTVYDYADGTTYELFEIEDGATVTRKVYDMHHVEVVTATAKRCGNVITVTVEGRDADKPWKVMVSNAEAVTADGACEKTERGVVVTPAAGAKTVEIKL